MVEDKTFEKSYDSERKPHVESFNEGEDIPEKSPEVMRSVKPEAVTPFKFEANIPSSSVVFKRASLDEKPLVAKRVRNFGFGDAAKIKRDRKNKNLKQISSNEDEQISIFID